MKTGNIILLVVVLGVAYTMWNATKKPESLSSEHVTPRSRDDRDDGAEEPDD